MRNWNFHADNLRSLFAKFHWIARRRHRRLSRLLLFLRLLNADTQIAMAIGVPHYFVKTLFAQILINSSIRILITMRN